MSEITTIQVQAQQHLDDLEGQVLVSLTPLRSKIPFITAWQNNGVLDVELLTNCDSFGTLCWPNSELLILDIDDMTKYAAIIALGLPDTRIWKTARGIHIGYRVPMPLYRGGPRQGKLPHGAGEWKGGQVRYHALGHNDTDIAEAPQWVMDMILAAPAKGNGQAASGFTLHAPPRLRDNTDTALAHMAGILREAGMDRSAIEYVLHWGNDALEHPKDGAPERVARSAMNWARGVQTEEPEAGFTIAEALEMDIPPIDWLVNELLGPGLYVFSGPPKEGKSFLALQLGNCISNGDSFLGIDTRQATVEYFALEDNVGRIVNRAKAGLRASPMRIIIPGGDENVADRIAASEADLVIVDTGSRVYHPGNDYHEATKVLGPVQRRALLARKTTLLVWHHSKDVYANGIKVKRGFDAILGSTGINAIADGLWMLKNNKLQYEGREIPDASLGLKRDGLYWAAKSPVTGRMQDVLDLLEEGPMTNNELSKKLGVSHQRVSQICSELRSCGKGTETDGKWRKC